MAPPGVAKEPVPAWVTGAGAGKDLGVLHIAPALPQVIAPVPGAVPVRRIRGVA